VTAAAVAAVAAARPAMSPTRQPEKRWGRHSAGSSSDARRIACRINDIQLRVRSLADANLRCCAIAAVTASVARCPAVQKMGTVVNPETKIDLRTIDLFDVGDVAKGELAAAGAASLLRADSLCVRPGDCQLIFQFLVSAVARSLCGLRCRPRIGACITREPRDEADTRRSARDSLRCRWQQRSVVPECCRAHE